MNRSNRLAVIPAKLFRTIILLFIVSHVPQQASAQKQIIAFPNTEMVVSDCLREITRQTKLNFAINLSMFDHSRKVKMDREMSLDRAMDRLLAGTGMTYELFENHIMIIPDKAKPEKNPLPDAYLWKGINNSEFENNLSQYDSLKAAAMLNCQKQDTLIKVSERIVPGYKDGRFSYKGRTLAITPAGATVKAVSRDLPVIALKTNLLYAGLTRSLNLSVEIGLRDKSTLDITAAYNPWNLKGSYEDNKKLVHRMVRAEYRWWLCERFNGHFFGAGAMFANYNVSQYKVPMLFEKKYRYEGYAAGVGASYGYHLMLNKHWGLEFNAGAGVAYMNYEKKDCVKCGNKVGDFDKIYVGPMNTGVKLVFLIK